MEYEIRLIVETEYPGQVLADTISNIMYEKSGTVLTGIVTCGETVLYKYERRDKAKDPKT